MVTCAICQKPLHYISNTHLAIHSINQQEYLTKYGGRLKSNEYMEKVYSKERRIELSRKMSLLRKTGVIISPSPSEEQKKLISLRMLEHNPMKDPEVAKKVGEKLRGRKGYERTISHRLLQREKKLGDRNPMYKGNKKKNYRLILWTKARKQALERDGYKCVACGMTETEHIQKFRKSLEVDHIVPFLVGRDNSLSNLRTLCRTHHLEVGKSQKEIIKNPINPNGTLEATVLSQDKSGIYILVQEKGAKNSP